MFRIKLILIGVGGFLAFMGFQEFKVSKGTKPEPANVELAAIEAGSADMSNAHIKLGVHHPAFFELIYYGEENTDKVTYVYYPVLSESHPFVVGIDQLYQKYPDGDIPAEEIPEVGDFSVLIKSDKYSNTAELPENFDTAESIQGLVVNKITKLKKEEIDLLRESFPNFDPEKVLLLEEGRKPAGAGKKFGLMGGGSLLSLIGLGWLVAGFTRR